MPKVPDTSPGTPSTRRVTDCTGPTIYEAIGKLGPMPFNEAVRALSSFLGRRFEISRFKSAILSDPDPMMDLRLDQDFYYLGAFSKLQGSIDAYVLILMPPDQIIGLLHSLTGRANKVLDDYQGSALQELANLILGAISSAMANELDTRIEYSVPTMAIDTLQTISDVLYAYLTELEKATYIDTLIKSDLPLDIRIIFLSSA